MRAARRRRVTGQAALEVVACVPLVLGAALLAWWLAAVLWAGVRAEEAVRRQALEPPAGAHGVVTVEGTARAPAPVGPPITVTVQAEVWAP